MLLMGISSVNGGLGRGDVSNDGPVNVALAPFVPIEELAFI